MGHLRDLVRGHLRRRRPRQPAGQVRRRRKQRGDLLPAGQRRIDRGAEGDQIAAGRRTGAGGRRLPPRVRADPRRRPHDRRGRREDERQALPGRGRRRRRPRRPGSRRPRPAAGLRALGRPGPLSRRQGGNRHRLHQGQRRGRTDPRSGQVLARTGLQPGRRARGEDHRRRRLLSRRDRSLRRDQRDPAAGRGQPRDLPPDRHLPLADVPLHPADRGAVRGDALALDRLRGLRAGDDDQRPVELDHVGAGARRRHRLRAAAGRPLPRGAAPDRRQARGDAGGAALGRAGDLRLGGDGDRGAALPHRRQGQRHLRPRPDRRDRDPLRGAFDADPAAGAADDLRSPRLLAVRPEHPRDGATAERDLRASRAQRRRRLALRGARPRRPGRPAGLRAAAAGPAQLAAAAAQRPPHPLADRRPARPRGVPPLRAAPLPARARLRRHPRLLETGRRPGRGLAAPRDGRLDRSPAGLLRRLRSSSRPN